MEQKTEVAALESVTDSSVGEIMMNAPLLAQIDAMAARMATSKATIPDHLKGAEGDCWAVVMQAVQWRMNPWAVAQKTHIVSGALGYEAQLVNAVISSMAPTRDRINYDWFGDWSPVLGKFKEQQSSKGSSYKVPAWKPEDEEGLGVRCWATMKGEDEPRVLELLLRQAQVRNSTLWASDPRQQLAYLAVKRWSRLHCPDVILGVYTPDELQEIPAEREVGPASAAAPGPSPRSSAVRDKIRSKRGATVDADQAPAKAEEPDPPAGPTFDDVASRLRSCTTLEDLQAVASDELPEFLAAGDNAKFREELSSLYQSLATKLKKEATDE